MVRTAGVEEDGVEHSGVSEVKCLASSCVRPSIMAIKQRANESTVNADEIFQQLISYANLRKMY